MTELASGLTSTDAERLAQAESVVRAWCGWHIAPVRTAQVVVVEANATDLLLLPTLKLVGVTSVVVDGEEVDPTTYTWSVSGWIRRTEWRFWPVPYVGPTTATVTMDHGYEDPPPGVTAVVQALAQRAIDNPGSLIRQQIGPFSDTYSQTGANQSVSLALLDAERQLLAPYALPKRP